MKVVLLAGLLAFGPVFLRAAEKAPANDLTIRMSPSGTRRSHAFIGWFTRSPARPKGCLRSYRWTRS